MGEGAAAPVTLGVDPGSTTGLAWRTEAGFAWQEVPRCDAEGLVALWEALHRIAPRRLLVERYRGGVAYSPVPGWVIGVVRLYAHLHGVPLEFRPPAPRARAARFRAEMGRHAASAAALLDDASG